MSADDGYEMVVPFALDADGAEVRAETVDRHKEYRCPDCHEKVILKRGTIKRAHFAHYPDHDKPCDSAWGESEDHFRAKLRIAEAIENGLPIHIGQTCNECRRRVWRSLPADTRTASLEYVVCGLPSTSGDSTDSGQLGDYRLDAALLVTMANLWER